MAGFTLFFESYSIEFKYGVKEKGLTTERVLLFQKTLKRNPSVDVGPGVSSPGADGSPVEWANIKLRKPSSSVESSKETSNSGDAGNGNNELKKVVLRKPRSHSAGDILDDRPKDEATAELKKILQRQKAAAEKGEKLIENVLLL